MSSPPHLGGGKRPRPHLAPSPAGTRHARLRDCHRSAPPPQTPSTGALLSTQRDSATARTAGSSSEPNANAGSGAGRARSAHTTQPAFARAQFLRNRIQDSPYMLRPHGSPSLPLPRITGSGQGRVRPARVVYAHARLAVQRVDGSNDVEPLGARAVENGCRGSDVLGRDNRPSASSTEHAIRCADCSARRSHQRGDSGVHLYSFGDAIWRDRVMLHAYD